MSEVKSFHPLSLLLLALVPLVAQETPDVDGSADAENQPSVTVEETPVPETADEESPATGDAARFDVPEEMALFGGHVGRWEGMTKTAVTEKGEKSTTKTRSQWTGGYLLGGHAFEIRGYSYGELGRTHYRWQYTYDRLKERFMGAYYDSHGRTHFCEGKVNDLKNKIIWRLIAPPGDMEWHAETDLQPENGIETNGHIKSATFDYDMVYTSVFRRS